MFIAVFFLSVFLSQNFLVNSKPSEANKLTVNQETIHNVQQKTAMEFPKGIVQYVIDYRIYDSIIIKRIKKAMGVIEASSCLVFQQIPFTQTSGIVGSWVHFKNPRGKRNCVHQPVVGNFGEIMIVIGFDCMSSREILQAVLRAIGFKDEVGHPHRDQYIKIIWENIQPEYRTLFHIQTEDDPYKIVEYDPMSAMHFQDRAFSMNGGPTIIPRIPGLIIAPSDKLSQLDVMKLRLWFGHECNKRKIGALLDKCKIVFANSSSELLDKSYYNGCKDNGEGDYGTGDYGKGDYGKGDYGKGDYGKGDYVDDDYCSGDNDCVGNDKITGIEPEITEDNGAKGDGEEKMDDKASDKDNKGDEDEYKNDEGDNGDIDGDGDVNANGENVDNDDNNANYNDANSYENNYANEV